MSQSGKALQGACDLVFARAAGEACVPYAQYLNFRYASGDAVEAWLYELLCLNATENLPSLPDRLPHPEECNLYYVERDTLFSYHQVRFNLASLDVPTRQWQGSYDSPGSFRIGLSCISVFASKGLAKNFLMSAGIRGFFAAHNGPLGCKPLSQHSK